MRPSRRIRKECPIIRDFLTLMEIHAEDWSINLLSVSNRVFTLDCLVSVHEFITDERKHLWIKDSIQQSGPNNIT